MRIFKYVPWAIYMNVRHWKIKWMNLYLRTLAITPNILLDISSIFKLQCNSFWQGILFKSFFFLSESFSNIRFKIKAKQWPSLLLFLPNHEHPHRRLRSELEEASLQPFHSSHLPCFSLPFTLCNFQGESRLRERRWIVPGWREAKRQQSPEDNDAFFYFCYSQIAFQDFCVTKIHGFFRKYTWLYNLILVPTLKAGCRVKKYLALLAFLPGPIK